MALSGYRVRGPVSAGTLTPNPAPPPPLPTDHKRSSPGESPSFPHCEKGPSGANELPVLAAAAWLQHPWQGIGPACARQEVDKKTQDKKAVDPDRSKLATKSPPHIG